jgi:hypothetical protein
MLPTSTPPDVCSARHSRTGRDGEGRSEHFSASVRARAGVRLAVCIGRARRGRSAESGPALRSMRVCLPESALAPSVSFSAHPSSFPFSASEVNARHASTRRQLGEAHQHSAVVQSFTRTRGDARDGYRAPRGAPVHVARARAPPPARRSHPLRAGRASKE